MIASIGSTYDKMVVEPGHQPALVLLAAFGITFGITRFVTHSIRSERFSWLGDIEAGDTHIHHLVWGIVLLLVSGLVAVIVQPPPEVSAVIFGVGAALTLDEFALWLHLDDVYWSEQGRQSIDAVIVFAVATAFMVLGVYPLSIGADDDPGGGVIGLAISHAIGAGLAIVCFLKGKLMWGVVGIYVTPIALIGAWRLAKPGSWWAGRRYDAPKLARSRERYAGEETVHKPAIS